MANKYVYSFGDRKAEGKGHMKDLLGGKGAGLAEMTLAGVPVPPGFTITTEVCLYYVEKGKLPPGTQKQINESLKLLEKRMGKKLGDARDPLLVSVRSGAKFSMPGMMDTVLNLGLNDKTVVGLAKKTGNPGFAWDSYRRFITMFGDVVLGVEHHLFEEVLANARKEHGVKSDSELSAETLQGIAERFKEIIGEHSDTPFPQDAKKQLMMTIEAVFKSWDNERAIAYRRIHDIPHELGTACNIQAMVFGNKGMNCATGVGFTRNPSTGEHEFYGEFLQNAQGEDVVAGIRTPKPLIELKDVLPESYEQLRQIAAKLEKHYGDMQDYEFTIEEGTLYMLQTRSGKRTGLAAVRVATDMVDEGLITKEEAVARIDPGALNQLLHPIFDPQARKAHPVAAKGLNASPGAASGKVVFTADDAVEWAAKGQRVILVRHETSPDDIAGMHAATGILTSTGGMTSHAAVVGRQMGKPSVVGCEAAVIDHKAKVVRIGSETVKEGDYLSIDGSTGEVVVADLPTTDSEIVQVVSGKMKPAKSEVYQRFDKLMTWADDVRRLRVRANSDTPEDSRMAVGFGAQGIGLCRTEHMFFASDRLPVVQEMILAKNEADRRKALGKLLPFQREDFVGIFKAMDGLPVTIRTLDPPLHEFLPSHEKVQAEIDAAEAAGKQWQVDELKDKLHRITELHELNPMLGWRGCRLGIVYPEITEMQARAIFEAAAQCLKKGVKVFPEVMIPLVGDVHELARQKEVVARVAGEVMQAKGIKIPHLIGTMIEVPRGALTAGKIAKEAEFFSFGTNDLTQTTFGYSRDDAGRFLGHYVENGILPRDPFVALDQEGVGQLMKWAVANGRESRPGLKIGICGEHGGEPSSVMFAHGIGLDYVSCSPYRIPVARLAAAQAVLLEGGAKKKARKAAKKTAKKAKTAKKTAKKATKTAKKTAKKAPAKAKKTAKKVTKAAGKAPAKAKKTAKKVTKTAKKVTKAAGKAPAKAKKAAKKAPAKAKKTARKASKRR